MQHIITPVKPDVLEELLKISGFDERKRNFLIEGFTRGFMLNYEGNLRNCKRLAPNLKLRVGNKVELWNKIMKEVELGQFAGPFESPPMEHFVQSPIGLVPKDKRKENQINLPFVFSQRWGFSEFRNT